MPEDIRITTRYSEGSFVESLMGVCTKSTRALRTKSAARMATSPAGEARGMALHESQSLLVEMQYVAVPNF